VLLPAGVLRDANANRWTAKCATKQNPREHSSKSEALDVNLE
jgi:hypothetical protein